MKQKWILTLGCLVFSTSVFAEQWNISFYQIKIDSSRKNENETSANVGFSCEKPKQSSGADSDKESTGNVNDLHIEAMVRKYNPKKESANTYVFMDDHGTEVIPGWTISEKYFINCRAYVEVDGYGMPGSTPLTDCHDKLQKDPAQKTCEFLVNDEGVTVNGRLRRIQ